ncbi:RND transporter (plasmid) [Cupriavidus sp. USMAHM13]|uniref:efflux transporter outer membrane subunit n=1 Tax=Cupriavidus sp. USMAHM13 TaxID=1389192 RepID=UPI0008A66B7A|nr:efflux transporter outer membrane subunit [Cupriavidus sp. USMAHM13]AOZ04192.1 RND transporter [Cupriavidus sp. USMAHM13]
MSAGLPARGLAACAAALVLAAVQGCALGPDFTRPAAPQVERYVHGGDAARTPVADGVAQRFAPGAEVPADWWTLFGSEVMDRTMAQALAGNPSLQAALASLRQSEAAMRAGAGVFYPQFDAAANGTRQAVSPSRLGQPGPAALFNLFSLGGTVSYTLDVFGGNRRTVEALAAQVDAQRYTRDAAWLTLTGNVAGAVIARAGYAAQIAATEALLALLREQVEITHAQVVAGTTAHAGELSLVSQLATFEATLPPLRQKLEQADHLIATLCGRFPGDTAPAPVPLASLQLPQELPRTLPSVLVRRRPDVLLAEAQLHVATAEVGVAQAAMFPNLTLSAAYGREATTVPALFGAGAGIWSAGAGIAAPLFHGGELYYRREAARAQRDAAEAQYRQAVLSAFDQVADALRALAHDAGLVEASRSARDAAREALAELQANYQAGTAGYLQVLVADQQVHQAEITYLQAVTLRLQDTVALFLALGGGWETGTVPVPDRAQDGGHGQPAPAGALSSSGRA